MLGGVLGESGVEDDVPEGIADSESSFFSTEVMSVVVLLKFVEPGSLSGFHMVQHVVGSVICPIGSQKSSPENDVGKGVRKVGHLVDCKVSDGNSDDGESWRVNQSVAELE